MKNKEIHEGIADLHVHTTFSDGEFTPEDVVEKALEKGLGAIAITDHDCVDGVEPAIKAARGTGLEIVPGIEMSAAVKDIEIHVLGYYIDHKCPVLLKTLAGMRERRVVRIKEMIKRLDEKGIKIPEEKVFSAAAEGTIGRMHLARAMVSESVAATIREVFDKFIGDGRPFHVKHERLEYDDAIKIIRKAGGVPVLAHPGNMGKDEYIPLYVKAGLKGIEVYHSEHRAATTRKYAVIAEEHGLIMTGGSDCHGVSKWGGKKKGEALMGRVRVENDVLISLRAVSAEIRGHKE